MSVNYLPSPEGTKLLGTQGLRESFLLEGLFSIGSIRLKSCNLDRVIVGAACPSSELMRLEASEDLRASYFCERRELGIVNIGGSGVVSVDGQTFELANLECLYVGKGAEEVTFSNADSEVAQFYLVSFPAHKTYPTKKYTKAEATQVKLGSADTANERVIYQYIHEGGIQSCQLVMGFTTLVRGSVWNTMPPHTHDRRSEVYLYFDVPIGQAVFHFMGQSQETRHLSLQDRQAVLSPTWSIHSGCGTSNYSFVWAMGGENQRFDDMDRVAVEELR